ncbi:MAG: DUF1254 domain-containing protein [Hyphomicrobiales bacterium]|nr:DUF1254 domain-containing protein [Hyphomicrobiales bacterium]
MSRRILFWAPWALACLFVAGIVHLSAVLMMPFVVKSDVYARLGGTNDGVTLLGDPANGKQAFPFQDPAFATGVCRFDLDAGPQRLRAAIPGDGMLSLAIYDRTGRAFYSTTDRAALRGRIDIALVSPEQLESLEASDPEDATPQELRLTPPTRTGFVVVRALIERPGMEDAAQAALRAVECRRDKSLLR